MKPQPPSLTSLSAPEKERVRKRNAERLAVLRPAVEREFGEKLNQDDKKAAEQVRKLVRNRAMGSGPDVGEFLARSEEQAELDAQAS